MEKIKFILKIWMKLSTHIRMRDRSVKILQYGSQMLLGFYANQFSQEVVECLRITQRTASTSRKAFWLFKSVNHVSTVIELLENYSYAADEGLADFLDILEQLAVIVYYWYETLVFACRVKMVGFTEDAMDGWGNLSWFLEDLTCCVACIIRTILTIRKMRDKQSSLNALVIAEDGKDLKSYEGNVYSMHRSVKNDLLRELSLLRRKFWDNSLSVVIALFELGASTEAAGLFKTIFGRAIGPSGMGLCGVCSSSLILFEFGLNAVREEQATDVVTPPPSLNT
mmetsp:Transcript_31785/g.68463  ORF Transcript_31785/g.68463 Transcript_31785/m.68463 type:complete len:282 (-) Transcript_31785:95-940(-)